MIQYYLNLRFGPSVVNVDYGQHVPLARLELIFDTMLVALPFDLQDGEQALRDGDSAEEQTF